jgi:predicted dehydrogenase
MKKIGMAVIGASMRSTVLLDYLKRHPDEGFVTGIYDVVPSRGEYLIREYGGKRATVYESLEQVMKDERAGAVFVGTPDYAHVEPVTAALRAGKNVYCEKPLSTTLGDCDAIIEVAKQAKRVFYLGMNLRHNPVFETLHEVLSSGRLGRLLTIEANEYYYDGRTYFRRWNRLREFGGGLWITKASHDFDLLNWFAGGTPTRVFATSSLSYYKPKPKAATHCRICDIRDECPDYHDIEKRGVSDRDKVLNELSRLTEEATGQMRDLCLFNSEKDTFDNGIAVVEYDNDVRATYTVNVVSARDTRQMRLMGTEGSAEGDTAEGKVTVYGRLCRGRHGRGQSQRLETPQQRKSCA